MEERRKIKLAPLNPRVRSTLLKLEKSLKEGATPGGPLMGSGYQRNTKPLVGQDTPYIQTITPQSSTEPAYKQPETYHPTD